MSIDSPRALFVNGSKDVSKNMQLIFEKVGVEYLECPSAVMALEKFESEGDFYVVVVGGNIKDMIVIEFIMLLRTRFPKPNLDIVGVIPNQDKELILDMFDAGATLVTANIELVKLYKKIGKYLTPKEPPKAVKLGDNDKDKEKNDDIKELAKKDFVGKD